MSFFAKNIVAKKFKVRKYLYFDEMTNIYPWL